MKEDATAKYPFVLKPTCFEKKQGASIKEKVDPSLQKEIFNSYYIICSGKCHWGKKVFKPGT